jgi:hypothetical protein
LISGFLMSEITSHDIIMNTGAPIVSRRQKSTNPLHHLWNNHGSWWFHATYHLPDGTAQRARVNLKTKDLDRARAKRDRILATPLHAAPAIAA